MSKKNYWMLVGVFVAVISVLFFAFVPTLSRFLEISSERVLAYEFLLIGISVFYFGFLRPHWFTKEIISTKTAVKLKVHKPFSLKAALKDDSHFWNLFPYALFFTFGGLAYLFYPSPNSLMVAFSCSAWVKILYKLV
jgi:hypothetical protein